MPLDKAWLNRSEIAIAHGALTNSKRASAYVKGVFPSHVHHGTGCYLFDTKGNRYIDFVGGLGTNLLGYGHPKITEAVRQHAGYGPSLSLPTTLEVELAETIKELFGFQKVRFFKEGSSATHAAVRIARSYKDRDMLLSEGYHAWHDEFVSLTEPAIGVPNHDNIVTFDEPMWENHLEEFLKNEDCASVIVEPVALDVSDNRKERLLKLSSYCANKSTILIFDEIITGLRVPKLTVQDWWQIKPDILVLGKAMANGFPISIVCMSDELADKEWFCSGTYCGELCSLAACKTTLDLIQHEYKVEDLWYYGGRLRDQLNLILSNIDVELKGYNTRSFMPLTSLNEALFLQEACKAGIIFGKAWFFSYAHIEANIEELVLNTVGETVSKIKQGRVKLEGEMPRSSFARY